MSRRMLPAAEHIVDVAVRRAVRLLREGRPVEDATRALVVGAQAAALVESEQREHLHV